MKVTILDPIIEPIPYKDQFVVVAQGMFGDGDGYPEVIFDTFENMDELEEFLVLCEAMQEEYPYGRGGSGDDEYDHLPNYDKWMENTWPSDPMADYAIVASFQSYEVFYYDTQSVKHGVKVEEL